MKHPPNCLRSFTLRCAGRLAVGSILLAFFATSASAVSPLEAQLGPGKTSSTGRIDPGTDLWRVDIDLSAYPDATCNDETPARIYVRAATQGNQGRWQIHLQGGGACQTGQACAERWKSIDTNFGAHKMSTRWAPPVGIAGHGILSPHPRNDFANWNHVYVYYCSSDGWSGRGDDVATSVTLPSGAVVPYPIDFHGADIVDAVVDTLRRGNGVVTYLEFDEVQRQMPNLDEATEVILTGSSAGGGGVLRSADRVFGVLVANNVACQGPGLCPLRVAAVPDATYGPSRSFFDYSASTYCIDQGLCTGDDLTAASWFDSVLGFWQGTSDESCISFHTASGDEWRCADGAHLLENHVLSPLFVRMDTQDALVSRNLIDSGVLWNGLPLDHAGFGTLVHDQLQALETLALTSEEARNPGPLEPPGAFGAQCLDHTTHAHREHFQVRVPRDSSGVLVDTNDLLWDWFHATGEREAIEPFLAAGPVVTCP